MNRPRLYQYDVVRVVAMLFVIAVHSLVTLDLSNSFCLLYINVFQVIFFTGNAMFFMLSGKFALSKETSLHQYYVGKIRTLVIPILVFFLLRTLYELPSGSLTLHSVISAYFKNLLGQLYSTEYWFLFVLIGNLLLAPLLGKAFRAFGKKEHAVFFVLCVSYHALLMLCGVLGLPFSYSLILSGWSFYFYLGYSAEKLFTTTKSRIIVVLLGGFGIVASVFLKYKNISLYIHDLSPLFTFVALGMFFGILKLASMLKSEYIKHLFECLAKHSFSVYLVHMMVLNTVLKYFPYNAQGLESIPYAVIVTIVVFVISFAFAILADHTIILLIQLIMDQVVKGVNMIAHRKVAIKNQ